VYRNDDGEFRDSENRFIPVAAGSGRPARSPELRMKLGEALVKATRICGELVPRFSQHLLPALLTGVKDPEPLVRASSLSNLGDVCQLLRFSMGPVVNEVGYSNAQSTKSLYSLTSRLWNTSP